tara:strand:- start:640 stop:822 length:183 start_codon:yes stop_codon:yes gene_type:complete
MTNQTRCGEGEIVANFEQLLDALIGDEMTHRCPVVCANNNTSFEGNTDGARSGLHDGLVF